MNMFNVYFLIYESVTITVNGHLTENVFQNMNEQLMLNHLRVLRVYARVQHHQ